LSNISSELRERRGAGLPGAALESLRPYQWLKNALVFVPLAAAHRLGEPLLLGRAAQAFVAFSLCASAVYLLNDLWDAAADRTHPHKRLRPIASGRLPRSVALVLAAVLLAVTIAAAWPLGASASAGAMERRSSRVAGMASQMKSAEAAFASSFALPMSNVLPSVGASASAPRFSA